MTSTIAEMTKDQIKRLRARAEECTVRNDRDGYNSFWSDQQLVDLYLEPARMANFRLVAEMCADWPGDVVDLGCGSGTMLQELLFVDRTGHKRITGLDYAESAIARCRRLLSHGTFLHRDLCETGFDDASFDLVLSIQTMEHLEHAKRAFDEMWRILRPSGRLLITIPNGEIDDWEGHCNFWSADSFIEMSGRRPAEVRKFNDNRNLLFLFVKPTR